LQAAIDGDADKHIPQTNYWYTALIIRIFLPVVFQPKNRKRPISAILTVWHRPCNERGMSQSASKHIHTDPDKRTFSMTTIAQRITAASTAFALSLALIAGTVHTPAPTATPAAMQEMI